MRSCESLFQGILVKCTKGTHLKDMTARLTSEASESVKIYKIISMRRGVPRQ